MGEALGRRGFPRFLLYNRHFNGTCFLAHFHANILFPDTRKTAVLIEWIGTGVVGMKKKGFCHSPGVPTPEQKAPIPLPLTAGLRRRKTITPSGRWEAR